MLNATIHGAKKISKQLLATFGPHRLPVTRGKLLILGYHRVLPEDDPRYSKEQPAMVVTPESLRSNIVWIREHFEIVSLSDWLVHASDSYSEKKCCAITFDDGWLDNYEFAFPILRELNVPVTLYCVPKMLEGGVNYWPGRLVELVQQLVAKNDPAIYARQAMSWLARVVPLHVLNTRDVSRQQVDQIIEACKIYRDSEINEFIDDTVRHLELDYSESREVMSIAQLQEMIASGLVEVGSHTLTHARLNQSLDQGVLFDEVVGSRKKLESLLGITVETFCYPNGFVTDDSRQLVRDSYLGGVTLNPGWNKRSGDYSKLRRIGMQECIANNKSDFSAKISGFY